MRYVGILMMAGAVMGIGFYRAQVLREQLELLQMFRRMIYCLHTRILYANDTLPEALMEVGQRFSEQHEGVLREPGQLFVRIAERLEEEHGNVFPVIWKEEVDVLASRIPIGRTDLKNLTELGDNLGYADRAMQEKTMQFYWERTDDSIEVLKRDVDVRVKLYRSLGAAGGVFLIILLI